MAIGMYSSVPCVLVWNSNNSAGHYKRATTSALQLAVANAGGFVASKLCRAGVSLSLWCLMVVGAVLRGANPMVTSVCLSEQRRALLPQGAYDHPRTAVLCLGCGAGECAVLQEDQQGQAEREARAVRGQWR